MAYWSLALVSECLLAYIFCDLINFEMEGEMFSSEQEAMCEDFDEDAELNAKMWNNFMRSKKDRDEEDITASL